MLVVRLTSRVSKDIPLYVDMAKMWYMYDEVSLADDGSSNKVRRAKIVSTTGQSLETEENCEQINQIVANRTLGHHLETK